MTNTYICSYARTPIGSYMGELKDISASKLGSETIKAVINDSKVGLDEVDEVIMGNVLSAGIGQAPARQAAIYAGLSNSTKCMTINKVCGSGLKAIMLADQAIKSHDANIIIAGGMENMSQAPHYIQNSRLGIRLGGSGLIDSIMHDGLKDPYSNQLMGNCAEILTSEEEISRDLQDNYAIESYKRSNQAASSGYFKNEIIPIEVKVKKNIKLITSDEEPQKFNEDKIKKLRSVFIKDGTLTAANASTINDGAASVLLISEEEMKNRNIKPKAKIIAHSSYAMDPTYFTKAPIFAIKEVVEKANLSLDDIDLFEINEAFSCVPLVAMNTLNISHNKINIFGGAVSLGHPIGASGTRILVTLINALEIKKKTYGLASLCIGGGEAVALIVKRESNE